jgi:hypothetical protein
MTNYIIAIPSYGRAKELNDKTLKTLHDLGIPHRNIHVFVVQNQQLEYIRTINPYLYGRIVVGVKGLVQQREFIENYYPEGTRIISLDDDIESLDLSLTDFQTADEFFNYAFDKCESMGSYIWGVYPVFNPFFRKPRKQVLFGLSFIIGAFYGYINRPKDADLKITLDANGNKEDVERSIRYWKKDGVMIRFNHIGFKTKYYGTSGGLGTFKERVEPMKQSAITINKTFPDITRIKIRKNGMYEIVFRETRKYKPTIMNCNSTNPLPIVESETAEVFEPELLAPLDPAEGTTLLSLLAKKCIPRQTNGSGRSKTFGDHRAATLGLIKGRVTRRYELSAFSKQNPAIYEEAMRIGRLVCPFEFNAIHLNHNVVCTRHIDGKNAGESVIVALGDYEGGDLFVDNRGQFNIRYQPLRFHGGKHFHWNNEITSGNKYSLVFFTSSDV